MADKVQTVDGKTNDVPPPAPGGIAIKRSPGHRGTDVRDAVAEMAARAQEISQEAGSKVAQAMKDVIGAAAGLSGFVIESARDLVQYMVRRGQMTQEEADKLMREAEDAHGKKKPVAAPRVDVKVSAPVPKPAPVAKVAAPKPPPAKAESPKPAPSKSAAKHTAKPASKAKSTKSASHAKPKAAAAKKKK